MGVSACIPWRDLANFVVSSVHATRYVLASMDVVQPLTVCPRLTNGGTVLGRIAMIFRNCFLGETIVESRFDSLSFQHRTLGYTEECKLKRSLEASCFLLQQYWRQCT